MKSDETLADREPCFAWLQNDPNSKKRNELMERYSFIANNIVSQANIEQQKITLRKYIHLHTWRGVELFFILMIPEGTSFRFYYDAIGLKAKEKISNQVSENYYRWCVLHNPITKHLGFTIEKSFENVALIAEEYSLNLLIANLLFEPAMNIGDGNVQEKLSKLKKFYFKELITFMKKLDNEGVCNDPKLFSKFEKGEKFLNMQAENDFLEGK